MLRFFLSWAAVLLPAAAVLASDDAAVVKAAAAVFDGIRTETLPNGLRVYLKPIPGAATVTTKVAYRVGSCDEDKTATGLAHYLEHLLFKGTDTLKPGDVDRITQRNGGANNAYTDHDHTIYHFDFAADRWEQALEIEADRMRNTRIDKAHEFDREKKVVVSELERNEDTPFDLEFKAILPLLFDPRGPYGHSVIGLSEHVYAADEAVIRGFYDRWYHPNNAALVIVGGFDPDKTLARVRTLFGGIPRGELPQRRKPVEVKRDGPVTKIIDSKFDVPRMVMGFNGVALTDGDLYALEVVQAVLSRGKTGRLYKAMVEGAEIANDVSAFNIAGRHPGWFAVALEVLKGKDRAEAEKLVLAELRRLAEEPVSDAELARVKRGMLADAVFGAEGVHDLADEIARAVTDADLEWLRNLQPRLAAVTAADVQAAARKFLNPERRVVVWSVPKKAEGAGAAPGDGKARRLAPWRSARHRDEAAAGAGAFSLKAARRVVLPNGLTVLVMENHRLPIVTAAAAIRHTRLLEPADKAGVAALTGELLVEGTTARTGPQISELIEGVGGSLSTSSSGATLQVLSPDRTLGLSLLVECLTKPTFPKDAFDREKTRTLTDIEDAETQPDTRAQRVYREAVYGEHPYGRSATGTVQTVSALSPADCAAFHKAAFVPDRTILVIVGDVETDKVIDEVTRLTADWKPGGAAEPKVAAPAKPERFREIFVTMPEAAQLAFYMGHVGITRKDPDYYKLLVMDNVLGTGPGFTDRLSSRLRDREGLAYTVRATIASSADEQPGTFTCYIGLNPDDFARARAEFLEEIARIRTEKPTVQEVEDAKAYLLGSIAFRFDGNGAVAGQLLAAERLGLGLDFLDEYRKAVAAVTPDDVRAVAAKHLDPERMVVVAAGAIDDKGKPLGKK